MPTTGAEIFCQILANSGVQYLFGNPGSTELPLMDALAAGASLDYRLALHEIPAMAMADGYAQATRQPAAVNLHVACGVGNAMGMLYNAFCAGSPLVVTAGQQDRRLRFEQPVLAGDLLGVTRPWTKWSAEVQRIEDIAPAVRRALQEAVTPPTGPVFLSLPVDIQSETLDAPDLRAASFPDSATRPPEAAVETAANTLVASKRPIILAGARVAECRACNELEDLGRQLGAPIYSDTQASLGQLPVRPECDLYAGSLPLWSPGIHEVLQGHDLVLIAGMEFPRQYIHHDPSNPLPAGIKVVQVDCNAREIARTTPIEAGLCGNIQTALAELGRLIAAASNWEQTRSAVEQCKQIAKANNTKRAELRNQVDAAMAVSPVSPESLIGAIARVLPDNASTIEEAPTTNRNLLAMLGHPKDPTAHFGHRGWALGWGLGCAIGVKTARPERPTLALLGDGAATYGIQGLWTAAHYQIPVTFVIANNAQYKILKDVGGVMGLPQSQAGKHVGLDIAEPRVDFVKLAESLGVKACRADTPDEVSERINEGLKGDAPLLIEVPISG